MRVLVLCYEYPPIGGGGGRVAQAVARELVVRGHEVRVQTAALGRRSIYEDDAGVAVSRTASGRRAPDTCTVVEMGLFLLTSFLPALNHVARWRPDVIHAHFAMPTGLLAWVVHWLTRVPYVITAHLGDVPGGVPEQTGGLFRWIGPIASRVWSGAAAVTAVSTHVQQLALAAYKRDPVRILNGIPIAPDRPAPPEINRCRRLLFIGRFNAQKNPLLILDVLTRLRDLPWHLWMVGDGPLRSSIESRVAERDLGRQVTLTGWLAAPEVHTLLERGDILLMPSLSEGMPLAAAEALQHGLAVVSSDIPGTRDVVDEGSNGWRLPLENLDEWVHKLRGLLESEETLRAMKRASWDKAHDFDLQVIAQQYESVLQSAVRPEGRKPGGGGAASAR